MFAGTVMVAVAAYHLSKGQHIDTMRSALKFGAFANIIAFAGTFVTGDGLSLAMTEAQPMKMAAAEALYNTTSGASFSIFSWGTPDGTSEIFSIRIPALLSLLSTHTLNGTVEGLNDLQAQYVDAYGAGDYMPIIWLTYWSFRWMIGLGVFAALVSAVGLWITRGGRVAPSWAWKVAMWTAPVPMLAALVGWTFAEMGRQPWLVFGLMKTEDGVSPYVTGWEVLTSLVVFTLIYGVLAVIEYRLIIKAAKHGPDEWAELTDSDSLDPAKLATVY
jgi:cytochrome d ubiquinol oxidase subunit I